VEKAVNLRKEKGIFAQVPNFQPKTILWEDTKQTVIDFYNNDQYSRCMPGRRILSENESGKPGFIKCLLSATVSDDLSAFK